MRNVDALKMQCLHLVFTNRTRTCRRVHTNTCLNTQPRWLFLPIPPVLIHNTLHLRPNNPLVWFLFPATSLLPTPYFHLLSSSPCIDVASDSSFCFSDTTFLSILCVFIVMCWKVPSDLFVAVHWLAFPKIQGQMVYKRKVTRVLRKDGEEVENAKGKYFRFCLLGFC